MIKCTRESFASSRNWVLNLPPIKRFFQPPSSSEEIFLSPRGEISFCADSFYQASRSDIYAKHLHLFDWYLSPANRFEITSIVKSACEIVSTNCVITFPFIKRNIYVNIVCTFHSRFVYFLGSVRCKRNFFHFNRLSLLLTKNIFIS